MRFDKLVGYGWLGDGGSCGEILGKCLGGCDVFCVMCFWVV